MKKLLVIALVAAGAFVAWKKYQASNPAEPEAASPDKTPGANMQNRVDNLSGAAPSP